jgi:hypothetical protein
VVIFSDQPQSFLTSRPEWTVNQALLKLIDGGAVRVSQLPFVWVEGAWEADVTLTPIEAPEGVQSVNLKVRVTPDTLRRWNDVGINPFIEACAQLQDHWRRAKPSLIETLTWL